MTYTYSVGNKIIDLGDGRKIVDLGRGNIYLGEGKAEVFLTQDELKDLCYSLLLMGYSKELQHKTESLFNLLSKLDSDLYGTGELRLEKDKLYLGYGEDYLDITDVAKEEDFNFWRYINDIGLERTGLAGGESPYEFQEEESEKVSLRKKLGALGIIGLIGSIAGAGIYCDLVKNQGDNNSDKNYITLKEIAEENNPELIKKCIWPLSIDIGESSVLEEIVDKHNQSAVAWIAKYKNDKKFIEIQIFGYNSKFEDFIKQLDMLKIPHKLKTYRELYEEIDPSSNLENLDDEYLNDIYSVFIPTEEFFKNEERLIKLLNQSTGIDEKTIARDISELELNVKYQKLLNNVSFEIKDYDEIDVENATSPYGDALELQKILWNFTDKFYSEIFKDTEYSEAEFDKLVKSLLKKEGYTIDSLNNMKTKDVLKVLAKLIEDNVEYDDIKADLIEKGMWEDGLNTPYETLKTGKGVCSDYSVAYKGVKKVLEDDIPKLKKVRITRNGGADDHEWNNIMYFDGNKLVISSVDLTWDDVDGIPLGSENNNTLTDLSAIDDYHRLSKK